VDRKLPYEQWFLLPAKQALGSNGRKRERARERETRVSPSRAPVFSCAHYFQAPPATQAIYLLDRINCFSAGREILTCTFIIVEAQESET